MIEYAIVALRALGRLGPDADPLDVSLLARFAGNTTLVVFLEDGAMAVVKLGHWRGLAREYATLQRVHAALPRYTAAPLALMRMEDMDVMVLEGVPHRPVAGEPRGRTAAMLTDAVAGFLQASHAAFAEPESGLAAMVQAAVERVAERAPELGLAQWMEQHRAELRPLAASLQHGDLSMSNIGLTADGAVIFDWEDFGHVNLPGFDLATLLLSFYDFEVGELLHGLQRPRGFGARLFDAAAPALGLDRRRFAALLPGYLACFIDLKTRQGYGSYVQNLAMGALQASLAR